MIAKRGIRPFRLGSGWLFQGGDDLLRHNREKRGFPHEVTHGNDVFGQVVTSQPLMADGDFLSFPL